MEKDKAKMGTFEKSLIFLAFILVGALIGVWVDELTGVSFKDGSSGAKLANEVWYMLNGMVILTMIKWQQRK